MYFDNHFLREGGNAIVNHPLRVAFLTTDDVNLVRHVIENLPGCNAEFCLILGDIEKFSQKKTASL